MRKRRPFMAPRVCYMCERELPAEEFNVQRRPNKNGTVWVGRECRCKACCHEKFKKWRAENRERIRELGRRRDARHPDRMLGRNLRRYGLTVTDYQAMNDAQGGLCAICGLPETRGRKGRDSFRLAVDHCHLTNTVRGLLCSNCNRAIGQLRDSPEIIRSAAAYLERHATRIAS